MPFCRRHDVVALAQAVAKLGGLAGQLRMENGHAAAASRISRPTRRRIASVYRGLPIPVSAIRNGRGVMSCLLGVPRARFVPKQPL